MNFLKGLALVLFSLVLIISLGIFTLAFTLKSTVLDADFINRQIEQLDISAIVLEAVSDQSAFQELPQSVRQQLELDLPQVESQLKVAAFSLVEDILAYLNRETSSLDLKLALKESFLNADFINGIVDRLDMPALAEDFVNEEFLDDIPTEITAVINPGQLAGSIAADLESWFKDQIEAAVPPVLAYILGDSQTLSVVIPLSPVKDAVRDNLWQAISSLSQDEQQDALWDYLRQNPPTQLKELIRPVFLSQHPEYSGLSEAQLDPYLEDYILNLSRQEVDSYLNGYWSGLPSATLEAEFNAYFEDFVGIFPTSAEIDQQTIGSQIVTDLNQGLADASDGLSQARKYTGWFIAGYWALIGLMLLAVALIILITNNLKKSSRGLGITFFVFGALDLAGVLITRGLAPDFLPSDADMPAALRSYLPQLLSDALQPLLILSLVLIGIGAALIVVSIFYKRAEKQ